MAITTTYRGIEYRSRLEARWAGFFTGLGWHYTYEPFDGDGYIPDFLIHGNRPLLVEVKPAASLAEYQSPVAKAQSGLAAHWTNDILIVGADPLPHLINAFGEHYPPAGYLGEMDADAEGWIWSVGNWFTCGRCSSVGIFHEEMTWAGRPCGHYSGDNFLRAADSARITLAWTNACNDVKWRGRAA